MKKNKENNSKEEKCTSESVVNNSAEYQPRVDAELIRIFDAIQPVLEEMGYSFALSNEIREIEKGDKTYICADFNIMGLRKILDIK